MRFFLDHNVDAECARVLHELGHDAWTASQAGRALATDEEQTAYAIGKAAVLVTHDREFTERVKRQPLGKHLRLVVDEPDGPALLRSGLTEVESVLDHRRYVVVELRVNGYSMTFGTEGLGELA